MIKPNFEEMNIFDIASLQLEIIKSNVCLRIEHGNKKFDVYSVMIKECGVIDLKIQEICAETECTCP